MYALQVKSLSYTCSINKSRNARNVFFDISSDGQPTRRFFAGRFAEPVVTKEYASIVHYCQSPVTIHMLYGPFYNTHLGVHTLYEFIRPEAADSLPWEQQLTFGKKTGLRFHVNIVLRKVQMSCRFELHEVTCLNQASFLFRRDKLTAEVEFNGSPHSIQPGHMNEYNLGTYKTQDVSTMHTHNNLSFVAVGNFTVAFFAKDMFSNHMVGLLRFFPADELAHNPSGVTLESPDASLSPISPRQHHAVHRAGEELPSGAIVFLKDRYHTLAEAETLFGESAEGQEERSNGQRLRETRRLTLSSTDAAGAVYEIVFSISIELLGVDAVPMTKTPTSWDFITNRDGTHELEMGFDARLKSREESGDTQRERTDRGAFIVAQKENESKNARGLGGSGGRALVAAAPEISNENFGDTTLDNEVQVLIDGRETFQQYYEQLMRAEHSVNILAWELALDFGLVQTKDTAVTPTETPVGAKWVTLEDVLLDAAMRGVKIRAIVWRHSMMTMLNRFLYMGPVEQEVRSFRKRATKRGLSFKVFHTTHNMPNGSSVFADPQRWGEADIIVIIAGNPRGLVSCHHEKLFLIDAECPAHTVAFTGGFDVAKGRYDGPGHMLASTYKSAGGDAAGVPEHVKRAQLLWHDLQVMVRGPATQHLRLHFIQRWAHSFTRANSKTRNYTLVPEDITKACNKHCRYKSPLVVKGTTVPKVHQQCHIRLVRNWKGSFDLRLFDDFCEIVLSAKRFLYLEQQYPFQNGVITYYMCEALRRNPDLRLMIVTPIKTDLPTGLVGEFFDWSQDHIIDHLNVIYQCAPDRVGIYGLAQQDQDIHKIKPIYVHAKLAIVDDTFLVNGSTNMDNISFFYCSEVSAAIHNPELAQETRVRLGQEHLGSYWREEMRQQPELMFDAFASMATTNISNLKHGKALIGRPIWMAPAENYDLLVKAAFYPNKVSKFLYKMGINTEEIRERVTSASIPSMLADARARL